MLQTLGLRSGKRVKEQQACEPPGAGVSTSTLLAGRLLYANIHSEPTAGTFYGGAANDASQSWQTIMEIRLYDCPDCEARTGFAACGEDQEFDDSFAWRSRAP